MMPRTAARPLIPAIARLAALERLDAPSLDALHAAVERPTRFRAQYEIVAEGKEMRCPLLVLTGWAAYVRVLEDGRRQFLHLLLPGDLIGSHEYNESLVDAGVFAFTNVETCAAPDPATSPSLRQAYALSRAHEHSHLLAQIIRLGRMNAQERIADLALELFDRLTLAGLVSNNTYSIPLTQEAIADTLGLTSVHVNRMLKNLRKQGDLVWSGGQLQLPHPARLRRSVGRNPVSVRAS